MRVVLPFDGSPSAGRAVDYIVDLAQRIDKIEVDLVNVQTAAGGLAVFGRDAADVATRVTQSSMEQGSRMLSGAVEKLKAAGVGVKAAVLLGEPAETIAAHVKDSRANAVVMGTRGLGAVGGLVLGSIASKVVHLVKVPITLVK